MMATARDRPPRFGMGKPSPGRRYFQEFETPSFVYGARLDELADAARRPKQNRIALALSGPFNPLSDAVELRR
jgi:hypothetical protein